jgi:hypothetical protein
MKRMRLPLTLLMLCGSAAALAEAPRQTEADGYTRYELLAPGSSKFRILYEISATTPGAVTYFNPIRAGSIATDERVFDLATGKPLQWDIVGGAVAAAGGVEGADPANQFIRVKLARPVPAGSGEARILIDKTYEDPKSYLVDNGRLVFERSLGVKRNAVVLPKGYELVSSSYPAQILQEQDGRMLVSFWNATPAPAPVRIVARPIKALIAPVAAAREQERAHQSREIVYYLNDPQTHSFALTHDYTEVRPGVATYVNIVRAGSTVSNPSGRNLDTGAPLRTEVVRGAAVQKLAPDATDLGANPEAVVFHFAPVRKGQSIRLRIAETYTDPSRYRQQSDGTLLWERTLGRPANAVILPRGWMLLSSNIPSTVTEIDDGRIRLDFINPRPDELHVRIIAHRRL